VLFGVIGAADGCFANAGSLPCGRLFRPVGVVGFAFVVGRFVPVAEIYSADGLFANAGSLPCGRLFRPDGELLFIAIKSNQKALARFRSTALALNSFSWPAGKDAVRIKPV